MSLSSASMEILRCLAYRHYWIPTEGSKGVVGGAPCIQWLLECGGGCQTTATEWRDMFSVRLPGTNRQYQYTKEYRQYTGYTQAEYITEIRRRLAERALTGAKL